MLDKNQFLYAASGNKYCKIIVQMSLFAIRLHIILTNLLKSISKITRVLEVDSYMAYGSQLWMERNGQLDQHASFVCEKVRMWQRLSIGCLLTVILLTGMLGAGASSAAAAAKNDKTHKVVYLSFDDGPGKHTPEVLDILRDAGVKATFLCWDSKWSGSLK